MNRRQFIMNTAAGAAAVCAGREALAQASDDAKLARIGMSSYTFHVFFPATHYDKSKPLEKPMDLLQFPEMIADRYRLHNLEIVTPHFESREPSYLKEVNARLKKAHSRIVNMPIDIGELWDQPGLSSPDEKVRERAISLYKPWFDVAAAVGASSVRCDPGKINSADLTPTISSYKTLGELGKAKKLFVIVENHGGVGSEHPEELIRILRAAGGQTGTLPDFGNFPDQATRERGLTALFPMSRTLCHVRDTESDASGNPVQFDLLKCINIAKKSGFKGIYSIEAETKGDLNANIQHVYDELRKNI